MHMARLDKIEKEAVLSGDKFKELQVKFSSLLCLKVTAWNEILNDSDDESIDIGGESTYEIDSIARELSKLDVKTSSTEEPQEEKNLVDRYHENISYARKKIRAMFVHL